MRKLLMLSVALSSPFLLTACATSGPATDGGCKIFKPITNSVRDTEPTRRAVVAHNKVYGAICKG